MADWWSKALCGSLWSPFNLCGWQLSPLSQFHKAVEQALGSLWDRLPREFDKIWALFELACTQTPCYQRLQAVIKTRQGGSPRSVGTCWDQNRCFNGCLFAPCCKIQQDGVTNKTTGRKCCSMGLQGCTGVGQRFCRVGSLRGLICTSLLPSCK